MYRNIDRYLNTERQGMCLDFCKKLLPASSTFQHWYVEPHTYAVGGPLDNEACRLPHRRLVIMNHARWEISKLLHSIGWQWRTQEFFKGGAETWNKTNVNSKQCEGQRGSLLVTNWTTVSWRIYSYCHFVQSPFWKSFTSSFQGGR